MQGTNTPTFRPTVRLWPADPGELPEVHRLDLRLDVPGELSWWGGLGTVPLPVDFILREVVEAGVGDDGLLAFIGQWGPLSRPGRQSLDLLPETDRPSGLKVADPGRWDLEVQRHHLTVLRACANHWLAYAAGADPAGVWPTEGFREPRSEVMAWSWWSSHVSAALSRFQMHVVVTVDGQDLRESNLDFDRATVYEAAMQQLAQIASNNVEILHCANERCGLPFTRQRGRAKYGEGHATGVLYCSNLCARARSERQRRARRAAERKADQS